MLEAKPLDLIAMDTDLQDDIHSDSKYAEVREISNTSNLLLRGDFEEDLNEFLGYTRGDSVMTTKGSEQESINKITENKSVGEESGRGNNQEPILKSTLESTLESLQKSVSKWKQGEEKLVDLMSILPKKNLQELRNLVARLIETDLKSVDSLRIQQERLKRGGKVA